MSMTNEFPVSPANARVTKDLIPAQSGELVNLLVGSKRRTELKSLAIDMPSWSLTPRQLCDLELLLNGGFSPLRGFMGRADYESVCHSMRLANGVLWPIPVTLDVPKEVAQQLAPGGMLALRDPEGVMLAVVKVKEVWEADRLAEAAAVYDTTSREHPGVAYLLDKTQAWYVGGEVEGLEYPRHYDFQALRLTPAELRAEFANLGWDRVAAFQTRNPMHRAHQELTARAVKRVDANLLIHPAVGMTKPGDVNYHTRVRCYQALLPHYPQNTAKLALLPLAMRMAGPREALWHAIIRKNYGCTHLIVGRDHAGPGQGSDGRPFYAPYAAQELLTKHEAELGVSMVPFKMMVYVEDRREYFPEDEVPENSRALNISGTQLRRMLFEGTEIPGWFTFPEVAKELRCRHRPRGEQGFTVFLTGLPSSGKSTIANVLMAKLLELGGRRVTLLDGDLVRTYLSSELGYSKDHRDLNIRRIGFVASEITKNGGIAICAPIAPYDSARKEVRSLIESDGGFVLVHVDTPPQVCEQRDRKGLYAKARAGSIQHFTGVSDPYEVPRDAELVIDTTQLTPEGVAQQIMRYLERAGYICPPPDIEGKS
ncbi:MAG TPA: bifunctional sulfate adenylyltransferase/adenylylsulfate kinase [Candidatus Acidoferrales bacterium]|nr:bifunctional sulfate adenylyltransferase/adenylylsulfate kinase [Candidatus Acidoferrales bacterium]